MALLLRKACQDALDKADLNAYHADIDDQTKYLCLYTPCGKHFAFVHGVRFGKISPTNAEIEFATELLEHWLARNEKIIGDYLFAWEQEQRLGSLEMSTPLPNAYKAVLKTENKNLYSPTTGRTTYTAVPEGYNVFCPDQTCITFNKYHRITKVDTGPKEGLKNGCKVGLPPATMKAAKAFFENWETLNAARRRLAEIHAELNSCSE